MASAIDQHDRRLSAEGHSAECYTCGEDIPADAVNWGFTWGSDGVYPDGASAMYCCWNCRKLWIYPPDDDAPEPTP